MLQMWLDKRFCVINVTPNFCNNKNKSIYIYKESERDFSTESSNGYQAQYPKIIILRPVIW